jgi:PAS domain S-box-containing protein
MKRKSADLFELADGTGDALANARLAAIVESSFDAIVSKDLDGIITSWNPAAEGLFGYSADEAIGQSILIVIPESHRHEEEKIIARIRAGERIDTFETIRRRKDGTLVPVSLTVSPIRTADGRIIGASKIARDISERRDSEQRIRLLLREVNHRVKNQYAVILSMVRETLKHSASPAEFEAKLRERIMALASSHDLLVTADWKGVALDALVRQQFEPYGGGERVSVSGPPIMLKPEAVQSLGMALHELATNSSKYGVLAHGGTIGVTWRVEETDGDAAFHLSWMEDAEESPLIEDDEERRGFGSIVLRRVAPQSLGGVASYERAGGRLHWTLSSPLGTVTENAGAA